jgi:hypothetical protein
VTSLYARNDRKGKLGMVASSLGEGRRYLPIGEIVQGNPPTIRLRRRKLWKAEKL